MEGKSKQQANEKGFTLMEILVYIGIFTIVMTYIIGFSLEIVRNRIKNEAMQAVEENARFALGRMVQELKEASSVNTGASVFGVHPGVLTLVMPQAWKNPTVYDVVGGKLRLTYGTNDPVFVTSENLNVKKLKFYNYSVPGYPQNIKIDLTLEYINPEHSAEYSAETSMTTTVTLRK